MIHIPAELLSAMRCDYENGTPLSQVAAKHGYGALVVRRRLAVVGVRFRDAVETTRSRRPEIDVPQLRFLLDEAKMSHHEMAAHFGVATSTLSREMRRLGYSSVKGRGSPMEKNYFWTGGRSIDDDGYILLKSPDHPFATKAG